MENSVTNKLFLEMRERFPRISEDKIIETINKVSGDRESCYKLLYQENRQQLESSPNNINYTENPAIGSSRTESIFFPVVRHGSPISGFSQHPWSNSSVNRQVSYPAYLYNGSRSVFQESGQNSSVNRPSVQLSSAQSAPVGLSDQKYFGAYNSQMRKNETNPYNTKNHELPSTAKFYEERESNNYGAKEPNNKTVYTSTLNINPAPPYSPNQFQFSTHATEPSNQSATSHNSPQHRQQSASVNFQVSPSLNRESHRSFLFSAAPGSRSHNPPHVNSFQENPHLQISISSSSSSNPYELFPQDMRSTSYNYSPNHQIPPRPTQSHPRNFNQPSNSPKPEIGINSNSQGISSHGDELIQPSFMEPGHPIGPISKPYTRTYAEEGDYKQALISCQKTRYALLEKEVTRNKEILARLKTEVYRKEQQLLYKNQRTPYINPDEMQKLREELSKLRVECRCLSIEVDRQVNSQVPLGVTDVDFYQNIFTGQPGNNIIGEIAKTAGALAVGAIAPTIPTATHTGTARIREVLSPSHQKASSETNRLPMPGAGIEDDEEEDKIKWNCPKCTYLNHPDLNVCEICETERPPYAIDSSRCLRFSSNVKPCYCHPHRI